MGKVVIASGYQYQGNKMPSRLKLDYSPPCIINSYRFTENVTTNNYVHASMLTAHAWWTPARLARSWTVPFNIKYSTMSSTSRLPTQPRAAHHPSTSYLRRDRSITAPIRLPNRMMIHPLINHLRSAPRIMLLKALPRFICTHGIVQLCIKDLPFQLLQLGFLRLWKVR